MTRRIIKDFEAELTALKHRKELLDNEILTVERMIRKAKGETEPTEQEGKKRQNVKGVVLGLLQERAELGLTPTIAVDLAGQRGITLEKATVSSLLSRLKSDSIVHYDGRVYRIARSAKPPSPAASGDSIFH